MRGLEAAPIGTFHAFCGELLRRFPIEAGVEPGFAIAEESLAPTVRDEALSDCIRAWLAENDEDLFALAVELGLPRVRELLSRLIVLRTRGDFHDWAERDPDDIVASWRHIWSTTAFPALLAGFVAQAQPTLDLLSAHPCSHPTMRERIAFLREAIPNLPASRDPIDQLQKIVNEARVQGGGTKSHWPSAVIHASVKDALTALRKEAEKVIKAENWDADATRQAAEMARRIARLAIQALDVCDRAKREQGMLDFDDLLLRARDLLRDPSDSVREGFLQAVAFVLIDEFQDTDPIQGEIVEQLAGDSLRDGRLFLVGDSKQSIYRFRGAQPKVFDDFRERFPETGRLQLTENFRSRPEILDFVNVLFSDTFPGPEHLLQPGPGMPEAGNEIAVEFLWAHEPREDEEARKAKVPVDAAARSKPAGSPATCDDASTRDGQFATRSRRPSAMRTPGRLSCCFAA